MHISLKQLACMVLASLTIQAGSAWAELRVMVAEPSADPVAALPVSPPVGTDTEADTGTDGNAAQEGAEDTLTLINGDSLHGALLSIDPSAYGIRWKHASAAAPIDFDLAAIATVKLATRARPGFRAQTARVRLTNSDLLSGELVSLNDKEMTLDTWYAGKVALKRAVLKSMKPSSSSVRSIYDGPTDLSTWTMQNSNANTWQLKKGALYSTMSYVIGRTIDGMPDMANLEFDVAWRSGYPQFIFSFFSDNVTSYSGNSYALQVSHTSVQLYRYSSQRGSDRIGRVDVQELTTLRKATFQILADRKNRSFAVLLNGRVIHQCTDAGTVQGNGNGIVFYPQNNVPMKFMNIRISEWDGTLPKADTDPESDLKEDMIRFVNDDKVSGHLESIAAGKATFKTSYATLDVPLERAVNIDMSTENSERARRNKNDMKAHFAEVGSVTVALTGIVNGTVTGQSENFGSIQMPLGAFRRLEFNIYRENSDGENDEFDF